MPFDEYFDRRSRRFSSFYKSQPVARALGRGALFDRLDLAVELAVKFGAKRVLDIGCGSGPLFAPLVAKGMKVTGIEPAPAMVALANAEAAKLAPGAVEVRQESWEDLTDVDAFDMAVALGVFDYLDRPGDLLAKLAVAAPVIVASYPATGLRVELRKVRYGLRGVKVRGYTREEFDQLAAGAGLRVVEIRDLGQVGWVVCMARPDK